MDSRDKQVCSYRLSALVVGMGASPLLRSPVPRRSYKTQQDGEILELSMKSPGLVKERAQKINKMASEADLTGKTTANSTTSTTQPLHRKRESKGNEDDDSSSVSTLDPRSKEWVLKAAKDDYHALVKLLKEEPKLAGFKDVITGFTALHWASKHGNSDTIKLISGTHKVNPNVKSHGGYTPLHIAAMFNRKHIMELLKNTYGADPDVRDHSGKKPGQYLRDGQQLKAQPAANGQSKTLRSLSGVPPSPQSPIPGGSLPASPMGTLNVQRTGGFFRNSLHQSFLRSARPSIRKRLKYKSGV